MLKRSCTVVSALALMATQTACYTTRIITGRVAEGEPQSTRQWFTAAGFASFSPPAGQQCRNGISSAEVKASPADWLLSTGLVLAGGLAGSLACLHADRLSMAGCGAAGASLLPLLVSSRTVEYRCAADAAVTRSP